MEEVKKGKDYTIFKKRSGRHCVKAADGKWINGDEKLKILVSEKLVKTLTAKKKEAPAEEPAAEEAPAE